MNGAQEFLNADPSDLIEMSKQGYFTILLEESLRGLEPAGIHGSSAASP